MDIKSTNTIKEEALQLARQIRKHIDYLVTMMSDPNPQATVCNHIDDIIGMLRVLDEKYGAYFDNCKKVELAEEHRRLVELANKHGYKLVEK